MDWTRCVYFADESCKMYFLKLSLVVLMINDNLKLILVLQLVLLSLLDVILFSNK